MEISKKKLSITRKIAIFHHFYLEVSFQFLKCATKLTIKVKKREEKSEILGNWNCCK